MSDPARCLRSSSTPPIWACGSWRGSQSAVRGSRSGGLFSLLVANLPAVRSLQQKSYEIAGDDDEYLLFDWLSELLYTYETERLLLAEFNVQLSADGLQAACRGEPIDRPGINWITRSRPSPITH